MSMPRNPSRGYNPRAGRRPKAGAAPSLPARRVHLATPVHGGQIGVPYVHSLLPTVTGLAELGVDVFWTCREGSLVHLNRNALVAGFLADKAASHLVFIDGDQSWQAGDVVRLLAHDLDLVAAAIPARRHPIAWNLSPLRDEDGVPLPPRRCPRTGAFEVDAIGTGMMCIKRRVFTRLIEAYPESKVARPQEGLPPETGRWLHQLFLPVGPSWAVQEGEDYAFCALWRQVGGKVWCDPEVRVQHHGSFAYYEGDLASLMQWIAAPGARAA
jgi:hypothetical protein